MEKPELGSSVTYLRYEMINAVRTRVSYPAVVVGYEASPDEDSPIISLVIATNVSLFAGAGWKEGLERIYSVPVKDDGHHYYNSDSPEEAVLRKAITDMNKGIGIMRDQLKAKDAEIAALKGLPSAADLDADAAEKAAAAATGGKPSLVKGKSK